jgi:hypothetical protein
MNVFAAFVFNDGYEVRGLDATKKLKLNFVAVVRTDRATLACRRS